MATQDFRKSFSGSVLSRVGEQVRDLRLRVLISLIRLPGKEVRRFRLGYSSKDKARRAQGARRALLNIKDRTVVG